MCVCEANSFIRLKSFLIESEIPNSKKEILQKFFEMKFIPPVSRQNSGINKIGPVIPARRFRRDGFDTNKGCV